jgi:uncharacterized membrane protein HdeD (DUF308 family)
VVSDVVALSVFGVVLVMSGLFMFLGARWIQSWTLGIYARYRWLESIPLSRLTRTRFFLWELRILGVLYIAVAVLVFARVFAFR